MNDFDYDALQKKRIARGAYHKKNGSKSKGCTLPSDYLTDAQKRKLNGEVKTMDLNRPMTKKEYANLTFEDKKKYAEFFVEKYNITTKMFADMLGYSKPWGWNEFKRFGVKSNYEIRQKPDKKVIEGWERFCAGETTEVKEEKPKMMTDPTATKVTEKPIVVVKEGTVKPAAPIVKNGDFRIVGTPRDVMNMLSIVCGAEKREFRISFGG